MFFNKQLRIISLEERIVFDASGVIFVDAAAASGGDGSSWAQAYNDLDSALAAASATAGADQIWIADGIYKPSSIYSPEGVTGGAAGLNDARLQTFNLPDNVELYGGFSGDEKHLHQRDPGKYLTVLSGDLLGNDVADRSDPAYAASKADNVWHVVTAGNDVSQSGVTALLDGITISGGYAAGAVDEGLAYVHNSGGGLHVRWGSDISLNDMTFSGNHATEGGIVRENVFVDGGGAVFGMDSGTLIKVTNSLFSNNVANGVANIEHSGSGGAINIGADAVLQVYDSEFTNNLSWRSGGAIRIRDSVGSVIADSVFVENTASRSDLFAPGGGAIGITDSIVDINDSQFIRNSAVSPTRFVGGGGAIFVHSLFGGLSEVNINSSYFEGNISQNFGGGAIFSNGIAGNPNSLLAIHDSTFIGNVSGNGGAVANDSMHMLISDSSFISNHSTLYGGAVGNSNFFDVLFGIPTTKQLTINDSTFIDNSVEPSPLSRFVQGNIFNAFGFKMDPASIGGGGAINNHANGNLVVNDSEFRGNQAINSAGGAILNGGVLGQRLAQPGVDLFYKDNLSLFNSGFKDNQAVSGGAVASISVADVGVAGNTIAIDDADFKKNSASADGGVLYLDRTSALLTDSVFHKNNTGDGLGDKIYARDANVNGVPSSNLAGVVNALKESNSFKNLDSDDLWMI